MRTTSPMRHGFAEYFENAGCWENEVSLVALLYVAGRDRGNGAVATYTSSLFGAV